MRRFTQFLHETDMFKKWLKDKGYFWPTSPSEQTNIMAEFQREGRSYSDLDITVGVEDEPDSKR